MSTTLILQWPVTNLRPGATLSGKHQHSKLPPHSQSRDSKAYRAFQVAIWPHMDKTRERSVYTWAGIAVETVTLFGFSHSENAVNKKSMHTLTALHNTSEDDPRQAKKEGHTFSKTTSVQYWHAEGYLWIINQSHLYYWEKAKGRRRTISTNKVQEDEASVMNRVLIWRLGLGYTSLKPVFFKVNPRITYLFRKTDKLNAQWKVTFGYRG